MSAHKDQTPGAQNAPESSDAPAVPEDATVQTAGAFDIRNFIGILLGLFGLVLLGAGIFAFTPEAAAKTGGVNANLWAGLAMVIFGILFIVWTKVDPIRMVVRDNEDGAEEPRDIAALD
ncbi:hypothetical protein [Brachybacterium sp. Z12]|uniref:hypothetical protein n=1 Tax=Brachybacterium sp. Z12 TaxID=2759167 RepID=UPI00223A981A|nr:hypothetical protein [Brachybacterium sp. Z12]